MNSFLKFFIDKDSVIIIADIIMLLFGAILIIFTYKRDNKNNVKNFKTISGVIIELLSATLMIITLVVGHNYTVVPDISFLKPEDVIYKLHESSLDFKFESNINYNNKTVFSFEPEAESVVRKGTIVKVIFAGDEDTTSYIKIKDTVSENDSNDNSSITNTSITESIHENDNTDLDTTNNYNKTLQEKEGSNLESTGAHKEISENKPKSTTNSKSYDKTYNFSYDENIISYNTKTIELQLKDVGVVLNSDNDEYTRRLGQDSIPNACVRLIDCNTNKVFIEKTSDEFGVATFENIPDGVYALDIISEGYVPSFYNSPFKIIYNKRAEEDVLSWSIDCLKANTIFKKPSFKVRIIDKNGKPVVKEEFEVKPAKITYNGIGGTSLSVFTDEKGFLCLWHGIMSNGSTVDYYDIISFDLSNEYKLNVCDKKGNYISITGTEGKNSYSICFE